MRRPAPSNPKRTGLARALSKLGHCSRSQAWQLIQDGRVRLNGSVCRNPEQPVYLGKDKVQVDGAAIRAQEKIYLMLNKPRGLVTTSSDENGRDTVYECFRGHDFPHLIAVGRLDKASEGLLLFTNDTAWASAIADPIQQIDKTYHVQINCIADEKVIAQLQQGISVDGDFLAAKKVTLLRHGEKNSWLEIVLDEGKNRQIRRLLATFDIEVLRLIRVSIDTLVLGNLPKGSFRKLTTGEINAFSHR